MMSKVGVIVLALSLILGALATTLDRSGPQSSYSKGHILETAYRSLEEVVNDSDVIFVGTIVDIYDGGTFAFGLVDPTPTVDAIDPDPYVVMAYADTMEYIQMAMVGIKVDEVLFERSPIDIQVSDLVTMTRAEDATSFVTPTAASSDTIYIDMRGRQTFRLAGPFLGAVGQQRLFVLRKENAPSLSGLYGPHGAAYSVLDISGSEVTISANPPIPIDIAISADTNDFLDELNRLIALQ